MRETKKSWLYRALPALTLMLVAPLITEVLPGATRISSIFVFPIEVLIWGGGAVMIRFLVRKYRLGWLNMLLLALALSVAEEVLIQQTSLAPLVIKLKGVEYARSFGVNYVYFAWALIYEALFVVVVPVALCEMIFSDRKDNGWLNAWGAGIVTLLFFPACFLAWYSWTQIARTTVFHLPAYNLPLPYAAIGGTVIVVLCLLAVGPFRRAVATPAKAITPLHPIVVGGLALAVSVVLFGLVVLAFGIKPDFPPLAAVAIAFVIALLLVAIVPGWLASPKWSRVHEVSATYGAIIGNCGAMFVGFIGAVPIDLYGKIILDVLALLLMVWLAARYLRKSDSLSCIDKPTA